MKVGNVEWSCGTGSLGAIIAIVVLVLVLILMILGRVDVVLGGCLAALALARLT